MSLRSTASRPEAGGADAGRSRRASRKQAATARAVAHAFAETRRAKQGAAGSKAGPARNTVGPKVLEKASQPPKKNSEWPLRRERFCHEGRPRALERSGCIKAAGAPQRQATRSTAREASSTRPGFTGPGGRPRRASRREEADRREQQHRPEPPGLQKTEDPLKAASVSQPKERGGPGIEDRGRHTDVRTGGSRPKGRPGEPQ